MKDTGWTCHVCGDFRPDERIDVSSHTETRDRVAVTTNIRFCNDREFCKVIAPRLARGWQIERTDKEVMVTRRFWTRKAAERYNRRNPPLMPSYRTEVEKRGLRWVLVAYQNLLREPEE